MRFELIKVQWIWVWYIRVCVRLLAYPCTNRCGRFEEGLPFCKARCQICFESRTKWHNAIIISIMTLNNNLVPFTSAHATTLLIIGDSLRWYRTFLTMKVWHVLFGVVQGIFQGQLENLVTQFHNHLVFLSWHSSHMWSVFCTQKTWISCMEPNKLDPGLKVKIHLCTTCRLLANLLQIDTSTIMQQNKSSTPSVSCISQFMIRKVSCGLLYRNCVAWISKLWKQ